MPRVVTAATSEPASGSVIAIAPIFSPAIAGPEVALPELVGAELGERGGAHVGLHADGHRDRPAAAVPELLHEDETAGEVAAGAAPALVVVEAEEPELAAAAEHVVGEVAGVLPLVDERAGAPCRRSGGSSRGARRARA